MKLCVYAAGIFSTCAKRQYFAAITDDVGHIIGTGYNGGPSKWRHCIDGGCERALNNTPSGSDYSDCIAQHAEINAILHSDYSVRKNPGSTLYVNGPPCYGCAKAIVNSGITRVVYLKDDSYLNWDKSEDMMRRSNISLIEMKIEDLNASE